MKVHEIMTAHARCVGPENTLVEAAGLMRELDVGALPVCENDRIAGMITDRDMAVRAIAGGRDPNSTPVREIMSPGVVYIFADQAVEEASRLMEEHEIRRLPVLNRSKRLVGVLSLGDVAMSSNPAFSGITLREVSQPTHSNGRDRKREALGRAAGGGRPQRPAGETSREEGSPRGNARSRGGSAPRGTSTRSNASGGKRQQRQRRTKTAGAAKSRGGKTTGRSTKRGRASARSTR